MSKKSKGPRSLITNIFWGPRNYDAFFFGLKACIEQLDRKGIFASDNLFTFGRQLGFLNDQKFLDAVQSNVETEIEKAIIWRTHILTWAAKTGLKREGAFVECGCYKGTSAKIVCDYVDFKSVDKQYYLYDTFEHNDDSKHPRMPDHGDGLFEQVAARFQPYNNVNIIKGTIPESFSQGVPDKVAFLHIDMNHAEAELAALEELWDRMVPGAILILDDYGWSWGIYGDQKFKEDPFFESRGYSVVELPTGQGMVIK
jgi:O-methyltransferase